MRLTHSAPYSSTAARGGLPMRAARHLQAGRRPVGAAQAASRAWAGGRRGDAAAKQPREQRTDITFRVPGKAPRVFKRLTQADLEAFLQLRGADGFDAGDGKVSRRLGDLPQAGTVDLVLPEEPPIGKQVANLQQSMDNIGIANEQEVAALLQQHAANQHPGSAITLLPAVPFKDRRQQDYLQVDAGLVVDDLLYMAEHKRMLGEEAISDMRRKIKKIRQARTDGSSPALAAALQGVTHAKLFLAGEAVRPGLEVQELVELAADVGMSIVLPSDQALGVVGAAPPVQL